MSEVKQKKSKFNFLGDFLVVSTFHLSHYNINYV